ncbi:MAG: ribosomal protein L7/L12 [Patescibacteria group bacterium]
MRSRKSILSVDLRHYGESNKVPVIKLLRQVTYLGLKDLKDTVERRGQESFEIQPYDIQGTTIFDIQRDLEQYGCYTVLTPIVDS